MTNETRITKLHLLDGITLKRKQPCAVLTVGDKSYDVERIGRGRYCTAWRNGTEHVWLQVHEKDLSKDALSNAEDNPHLPKCEAFGWFDGDAPYRLYREPLYQPLKAAHKVAWQQFKSVYAAFEDARRADFGRWNDTRNVSQRTSDFNTRFLELVGGSPTIPDTLRDAVRILVQSAAAYGDYGLEISKKNCAVGSEGQLILLDPLFDRAEVEEHYRKARQRARGY